MKIWENNVELTVVELLVMLKSPTIFSVSVSSIVIATIEEGLDGSIGSSC
jgi:hypothetical protein